SMQRFDIRDEPERVMPLGEDSDLEYALDLKTGQVIAARPHRDLDPADGPLPSVAAGASESTDADKIDLDAILSELELEDEFPQGPLLTAVRQVLEEDGFEFDRTWPNQIDVEMLSDVDGRQTAS